MLSAPSFSFSCRFQISSKEPRRTHTADFCGALNVPLTANSNADIPTSISSRFCLPGGKQDKSKTPPSNSLPLILEDSDPESPASDLAFNGLRQLLFGRQWAQYSEI